MSERPTAAEVQAEITSELEELRDDWRKAVAAAGLDPIEARLRLLEAEVALYRHRLAEQFALDAARDPSNENTRGENTLYAVVDNEREALVYALLQLEDGVPFAEHMAEWADL